MCGKKRTQGESQTPRRGFGFPQRLREREEKRKHGVDETNQTKKKEGHIQKTKHGSGLEGLKDHTRYQPQRQKPRHNQPDDKNQDLNRKTNRIAINVSRDLFTAGWRGPWAALPSPEESPRGTLIPRDQMVPPSRVRPRGAEVST